MIKQEDIIQLVEEKLADSAFFLVKASVGKDNLINIYIDGDKGVTIDDCVKLSRYIEQQLDCDQEDYELRVSSPGADEPFVNKRQYSKNIGRPVNITLTDGTTKRGLLDAVEDTVIVIKEEVKSKNKKQKQMTTGDPVRISFDTISETKVIIIF